ncbi:hypothetical protein [Streptomyces sp. NPDC058545]|uniref:hypothetical protein n=1 Tax=Streptomyces sp. NPDC058545 TaxID=3346544 RepID=UPI00364F0A0E
MTTSHHPARSCPQVDDAPSLFSVWDLVMEAAMTPAHSTDDGVHVYPSQLLGAYVARSSVLALAELVPHDNSDAGARRLYLERADGADTGAVVVTTGSRRFRLAPDIWPRAYPLCGQAGCAESLPHLRTLCDVHLMEGGKEEICEETVYFARRCAEERDFLRWTEHDLANQLMRVTVQAGLPPVEHAQFFAQYLNHPDPEQAEEWDLEDRANDIAHDAARLLHAVVPTSKQRSSGDSSSVNASDTRGPRCCPAHWCT